MRRKVPRRRIGASPMPPQGDAHGKRKEEQKMIAVLIFATAFFLAVVGWGVWVLLWGIQNWRIQKRLNEIWRW